MASYAGGNPGLGLTRQSSAGRVMERSRAPRGGWAGVCLRRAGGQDGNPATASPASAPEQVGQARHMLGMPPAPLCPWTGS